MRTLGNAAGSNDRLVFLRTVLGLLRFVDDYYKNFSISLADLSAIIGYFTNVLFELSLVGSFEFLPGDFQTPALFLIIEFEVINLSCERCLWLELFFDLAGETDFLL